MQTDIQNNVFIAAIYSARSVRIYGRVVFAQDAEGVWHFINTVKHMDKLNWKLRGDDGGGSERL